MFEFKYRRVTIRARKEIVRRQTFALARIISMYCAQTHHSMDYGSIAVQMGVVSYGVDIIQISYLILLLVFAVGAES